MAPLIVVVLAAIGTTGRPRPALVSTCLCFVPVAIGMMKGLRSPERLQLDPMRSWNANDAQILRRLRSPSSVRICLARVMASLLVSLTVALVGADERLTARRMGRPA